jgi:hypothetical protein
MRERGKSIEMVVLIKIGCVRLENAEQGSRRHQENSTLLGLLEVLESAGLTGLTRASFIFL